jgi:hypothetical protein
MKDIIKKIYKAEELQDILVAVFLNVYSNGPISSTDMEILSLMSHYQPEFLKPYLNSILSELGLNYKKDVVPQTLADEVFTLYKENIIDKTGISYTPVQADILTNVQENHYVSISAPTSTGKSFVLHNLIKDCPKDVVVVVPSRALINEYFTKLKEEIQDRSVNILTFIDKINTEHCRKSIFVVTPERCRELFKMRTLFNVGLFLFDEAQLSNEHSIRGLYFDSIVRRCKSSFPKAKFVFAHPFVSNPEAQFEKNGFYEDSKFHRSYKQKNVGQMFYCKKKDGRFALFGIDKEVMGERILNVPNDPIADTLNNNGCVLVYLSKSKILNGSYYEDYGKYISLCQPVDDGRVEIMNRLKEFTGGSTAQYDYHYSSFIDLLKKGVVTHHGSLPLKVRILLEEFVKKGYCRICFATSTLEQGVNMPFDLVCLDRLDSSKPLFVKNLIGRAGRSTDEFKFDYGIVVVNHSSISDFRNIFNQDVPLDNVSELDKDNREGDNDDNDDFKTSIKNGTFNDEYNLTNQELDSLTSEGIEGPINNILNLMFDEGKLIEKHILFHSNHIIPILSNFDNIYRHYLGRDLLEGEKGVLETAVGIILKRIEHLTFKEICRHRFDYIANITRKRNAFKDGLLLKSWANFSNKYQDLPNSHIFNIPLYTKWTPSEAVDYDIVMYDTYDYIDKLIGFRLTDIFYAAFFKYYEKTHNTLARRMANFIRYGTDNQRYIYMLRYGMDFDDIKNLDQHIESIDETHITVKDSFYTVDKEKRQVIERFI